MVNSHRPRGFHSTAAARRPIVDWVVGLAACFCLPAFAADEPEADTWTRVVDIANPYVSVKYSYDSNLLRLDDDAPLTVDRSDRYATLSAGFDSDIAVSQQLFELSGVLYRSMFDSHDELDYTGANAAAIWNWTTGGLVTGKAGYTFKRSLRSFANQLTLQRIKEIRTENRFLGSVEVDLPGNWRLGASGDLADISFSAGKSLALKRNTAGATIDYVSRAGNVLGLGAKLINGDYDANTTRDFDEYTVGPALQWQLTAKTRINANVGYTNHDVADPARLDHDDITGRVVVKIGDPKQSAVTAAAWREVSNLGDEIAEFALVQGISIEPFWQLSSRVGLHLHAGYEDRDFKGIGADAERQDDVFTGGALADWALSPKITLSLGVNAERRASTRVLQDYDFSEVQLQITGTL
jgi:hypothetical protein